MNICYITVALFGLLFLASIVQTVEGIKVMGFHNRLVRIGLLFLIVGGVIFSILILRMFQYSQQGLF